MDQNTRIQYLKQLAASNEGLALKEYIEELIVKLVDSRNYNSENFEIEGKAAVKAAAILQKVLRDLELLKRKKTSSKNTNQYI